MSNEEQFGWFMKALKANTNSFNAKLDTARTNLESLKCAMMAEMAKRFTKSSKKIDDLKKEFAKTNLNIHLIREEIEIFDNFTFYCAIRGCHEIVATGASIGDDERVAETGRYHFRA